MKREGRRIASNGLALAVSLGVLGTLAALILGVMHKADRASPKVVIGTKDEVYYSHAATSEDAIALGHALQTIGYLSDRGAAVLLSRNPGGAVVSFVLKDGLWNSAAAVTSFEEIGRRIARLVGGFPIEVRLVDTDWKVQKSMQVGKVQMGARDEIYYLGSATEGDAVALGKALRDAGYLKDLGVSVSISKGDETAIGFVVGEGVWRQPEAVARFESLARRVAGSIGGLPVQLRLLSPEMESKLQSEVH